MDSFERAGLEVTSKLTMLPFVALWYATVWGAWMCFVAPCQLVFWMYEIAVWVVATAKRRPFSWRITAETLVLTPPWLMDNFSHPSRVRRDRQRLERRNGHLTDADRRLHLPVRV